MYGAFLVMLLIVFFFERVMGSSRWISLGPIDFQPSEYCKLALNLVLANFFSDNVTVFFQNDWWVFETTPTVDLRPGTSLLDAPRQVVVGDVDKNGLKDLVAVGAYVMAADPGIFSLVAFRSLQITLSIPGGTPVYIASLFLGTLVAGSLVLPSRRWTPSESSRRVGFGLVCIWTAGVQPTHPYQFALVLVGFLYLAKGLLVDDTSSRNAAESGTI